MMPRGLMKSRVAANPTIVPTSDTGSGDASAPRGATSVPRQATLLSAVIGSVALISVLISHQKAHVAHAGAGSHGAAIIAVSSEEEEEDVQQALAPMEPCMDLRAECPAWAVNKEKFIGLFPVYMCDGLNKEYMQAFCRKTCGMCDEPAPPEYDIVWRQQQQLRQQSRQRRKRSATKLPAGHPIVTLRHVVLAKTWPLLEEFFTIHAKTFRIYIDETCTRGGGPPAGSDHACQYLNHEKKWDCVGVGSVGRSDLAHTIFNGWQNPQCKKEGSPKHDKMLSSTYEVQWHQKFAAEAYIPAMISRSPWLTKDFKKARATLAVMWASCLSADPQSHTTRRCNMNIRKTDAFRRDNGSSLFFVLSTDYGVCSWNQVMLAGNTFVPWHIIGSIGMDAHPCFDRSKDITVPTSNALAPTLLGAQGTYVDVQVQRLGGIPQERPKLAFFLMGSQSVARKTLHDAYTHDPDMWVRATSPPVEVAKAMLQSKFCIQADGNAPWSPRLVQFIFTECVPVFVSDNFLPPFYDVLDWSKFSISMTMKDLPRMKEIILAADYKALRANLRIASKAIRYEFDKTDPDKDMNSLSLLVFEMWRRVEHR